MQFPVVIHKDIESDYGVTVPDLPGCFSAGETVEEALHQITEAIELHLEGMLIDGDAIPKAHPIAIHQSNPDYANGIWAIVDIDLNKISGETKRVNITLPERLVTMMDRYAVANGKSRSGLIAEAAVEYIAMRNT